MKTTISKIKSSVIITLILSLIIFSKTFAQNTYAKEKLCLWEVKNSETKVYILGSIHLMPENIYPLDERINGAFSNSDILVVEADITKNQNEIQNLIAEKAIFQDSTKNLKNVLPNELYVKLTKEFKELDVDIKNLNKLKPWFVTMTLASLRLSKIDVTPGKGVDVHFLNLANEKTMKILELESVGSQLMMFSSMSITDQTENLQYQIDENNQNENYLKMLEAWKKGDLKTLNEISRLKMKEDAKELNFLERYYNMLFTEREEAMTEKIESYLNDDSGKTYFIIIGVFHLVGDDGLIKILQKKGYKTNQY